jgi:hypothetical protein
MDGWRVGLSLYKCIIGEANIPQMQVELDHISSSKHVPSAYYLASIYLRDAELQCT